MRDPARGGCQRQLPRQLPHQRPLPRQLQLPHHTSPPTLLATAAFTVSHDREPRPSAPASRDKPQLYSVFPCSSVAHTKGAVPLLLLFSFPLPWWRQLMLCSCLFLIVVHRCVACPLGIACCVEKVTSRCPSFPVASVLVPSPMMAAANALFSVDS